MGLMVGLMMRMGILVLVGFDILGLENQLMVVLMVAVVVMMMMVVVMYLLGKMVDVVFYDEDEFYLNSLRL